jgi:hypothetical protein
MTQTTGATNLKNVVVEISKDNTEWTNISGTFNSIDISGGERDTGEVYTAEGDMPIVGAGKMKMTKCKLKVVYTESQTEAWRTFFDAYTDGTDVYLRYAPKGNDSGNLRFTSGKGFVTAPVYPTGDVAEAKPVLCELEFVCPGFTPTAIPAA